MDGAVRDVAERFYRSFLAADRVGLSGVVAPDATLIVPSNTLLSGTHRGPDGIAMHRELIAELTGGTWRPLRDDSFDIAASPWHAVILDRYVAERGNRRLDSHEAVVVAVEESRIVRLFHYVHDARAFAFFWSR